ncbi:hypothetical protein JHK85_006806 [Glycine max]|nr:hypothetical protein JHK85_006806 [Glycine max]KAG5071403.1 hypothetical protein JHK86_006614 [Glycine max]
MEERFSTIKPPSFKGKKCDYWKERMIAHFEPIHKDLWNVVENGDYIPYDDQLNEIPRGQWTEEKKLRLLLNSKARNVMLYALSEKKYTKVKRNKLSLLIRKYELFSMEDGEDIQSMFGCFETILNELRSLGKTYDNYDHHGHFKFEFLELEKGQDKKKHYKIKEKKGLMSTLEDLDGTSSNEDDEEANKCLMTIQLLRNLNQIKKMR